MEKKQCGPCQQKELAGGDLWPEGCGCAARVGGSLAGEALGDDQWRRRGGTPATAPLPAARRLDQEISVQARRPWVREEVRHGRNSTGKGRTMSSAAALPMACRWGSGWSRMPSVARRPRKTSVDRLLSPSFIRVSACRGAHTRLVARLAAVAHDACHGPARWTRWTRRTARRTGGGSTERERSTATDSKRPYTGRPRWLHVGRRMGAHTHARAQRRDSRHPFEFHLPAFGNAKLQTVETKLKMSKN
jgi:hypothetical protein